MRLHGRTSGLPQLLAFAPKYRTDAIFMIGACAAFVSYLINKHRASESGG